MKRSEGENRGSVETGETTEGEKLRLAANVEHWERQTAALGQAVKQLLTKAWDLEAGIDSEQALMEA